MQLTLELITILTLVATGAGFIDAIAGGGGLLTMPALLAAGVPPVSAVATNKLQSTFGTSSACIAYARAGHLDFKHYRLPILFAFIGSIFGALLLQRVDSAFLSALMPIMLVAIALYFLLAPKMSDLDRKSRLGIIGLSIVIGVIGFYDGFFGPGAGAFYATALLTLGGLGLIRATAHTKAMNLSSNIAALGVMIASGHVLWVLGLAMAAGSITGGYIGSRTAMRFGTKLIRPLLIIMSLALTTRLLSDPANPLRQWLSAF